MRPRPTFEPTRHGAGLVALALVAFLAAPTEARADDVGDGSGPDTGERRPASSAPSSPTEPAAAATGDDDAQIRLGGWRVSGDLAMGGRTISGDFRSARFNVYRSLQPGFWSKGLVTFDNDRGSFAETWLDFVSVDEQSYNLRGGRLGLWGLELGLLRYQHDRSENVRTPYWVGNDGTLRLPNGWARNSTSLGRNMVAFSHGEPLDFRIYDGTAKGFWRPMEGLEVDANYRIWDRNGSKLGSGSWFFTNFANFTAPVDERIHEVKTGAKLNLAGWSVGLDYIGSFYRNDVSAWTVDNPLVGFDSAGSSSLMRLAPPPENNSHMGVLSAARAFEVPFPVRVAGNFSYGRRSQNDDFLPYTVNTALPTMPFREDLDGKVDTWLADVSANARPVKDVSLRGRYRYYNLDDRTPVLSNVPSAPGDSTSGAGLEPESLSNAYGRHTAEFEATWRIRRGLSLDAGYEWEAWRRDAGSERRELDDHRVNAGLDWRLNRMVWTRLSYQYGVRRGGDFDRPEEEFREIKKFNLADRLLNRVDLLVQVDPREDVGLSFNLGFRDVDYDHTEFGLFEEQVFQVGGEVVWQPLRQVSLSSYYTFDYGFMSQRSRDRGSMPDTDAFNWETDLRDRAHNLGVNLDLDLIPDRLTGTIAYDYQIGTAETRSSGVPAGAVDFPNQDDVLHSVRLNLEYRLNERLSLLGEYRYEQGNFSDFQKDTFGYRLDNNLLLDDRVDDYRAHILGGGVKFHF